MTLENLPEPVVEKFLAFGRRHPEIISAHELLLKLTIFDFVEPLVRTLRPRDLLEIGCAQGFHSALLSRLGRVQATELATPGGFVDVSDAINVHRRTVFDELASGPVGVRFNDGLTIPYDDGSFDLVYHNSVIEHVPDPCAFNREAFRVLRPGGACIAITGTPALCWLRFVRDWLMLLPLTVPLALMRETIPTPWLARLGTGVMKRLGLPAGLARKVASRLTPVPVKVATAFPGTDTGPDGIVSPTMYPRLAHVLDSPEYNRIVLERLAREAGVTPEALVKALRGHFEGSLLHRLRFSLAPRTHGQHYRDAFDEMREWAVAKWSRSFVAAGFETPEIRPYRFHHVLEVLPLRRWGIRAFHAASPLVRRVVQRRSLPAGAGSEILIVARKPDQPSRAAASVRRSG